VSALSDANARGLSGIRLRYCGNKQASTTPTSNPSSSDFEVQTFFKSIANT
jgi:hypothetical protein